VQSGKLEGYLRLSQKSYLAVLTGHLTKQSWITKYRNAPINNAVVQQYRAKNREFRANARSIDLVCDLVEETKSDTDTPAEQTLFHDNGTIESEDTAVGLVSLNVKLDDQLVRIAAPGQAVNPVSRWSVDDDSRRFVWTLLYKWRKQVGSAQSSLQLDVATNSIHRNFSRLVDAMLRRPGGGACPFVRRYVQAL